MLAVPPSDGNSSDLNEIGDRDPSFLLAVDTSPLAAMLGDGDRPDMSRVRLDIKSDVSDGDEFCRL